MDRRPPRSTLFPYTPLFRSQLSRVTEILSNNRAALAATVDELAPFVRVFTNTLGNGRWFDSFVNDLLPTVIGAAVCAGAPCQDRKSTRLNSSHANLSYAAFC